LNAGAGIFSFLVEVNALTLNNLPFYVTDTSAVLPNQFRIIYDNGQMVRVITGAEVSVLNKFMVRLKGEFAFYSMDNEEKAWQRPGLNILLEGKYRVAEKLILNAEIYYVGKRFAKNFEENKEPITLDGFADLNLGAEYFITDRFTAFLSFKNLINQQYQRWQNYPVQGFQAMGGVTFSF
jgi:outer membrane cobalamin receptor